MDRNQRLTVFLGFDPKEMAATVVADCSLKRHCPRVDSRYLSLLNLQYRGWYKRPTLTRPDGSLWDTISDAPMSTQHAIGRFFVPHLMNHRGWALFTDGDVLFREDVSRLFDLANPKYALMCVKHPPLLAGGTKKDGAVQQPYPRKNWSSVVLWNCNHSAHRNLTPEVLNLWPGRDLHAFGWLEDSEIGELPGGWNHLVNVSSPNENVYLAHFTLGIPSLAGHGNDPFADEWFDTARVSGYGFERQRESA